MSFLVCPSMAPRVKVRLYNDLQDLTGHDISPHLLKTADPTILSLFSLLPFFPALLASNCSSYTPASEPLHGPHPLPRNHFPNTAASSHPIFSMNPTLKTLFIIATYSYFSYTLDPPYHALLFLIALILPYNSIIIFLHLLFIACLSSPPTRMSAPWGQGFMSDCCIALVRCLAHRRTQCMFVK